MPSGDDTSKSNGAFFLKLSKRKSVAEDSTRIPNSYFLVPNEMNPSLLGSSPSMVLTLNPFCRAPKTGISSSTQLAGMVQKRRSLDKTLPHSGDVAPTPLKSRPMSIRRLASGLKLGRAYSGEASDVSDTDLFKRKQVLKLPSLQRNSTSPNPRSFQLPSGLVRSRTLGTRTPSAFAKSPACGHTISRLTIGRDSIPSWETETC